MATERVLWRGVIIAAAYYSAGLNAWERVANNVEVEVAGPGASRRWTDDPCRHGG